MNWIKKLANHSSQYFIGEILVIGASFISFPIFVKILTLEEYGIMNIISMTIRLMVFITAAGLKPALFRFYCVYQKQSAAAATRLFVTLFWTTIIFSLLGILMLNLVRFVPENSYIPCETLQLLGFAAILIVFQNFAELVFALIRIHENVTFYVVGHVLQRYAGMIFAVLFLVYWGHRLKGLYEGLILGEGLIVFFLLIYIIFQYRTALFQFSYADLKMSARYGIPLIGQNISHFINSVGDRYVIQFFLGEAAVALYSFGYNLASYVQNLFVDTLDAALVPITMNISARQGKAETEKFISQYFSIYIMIAFPVILGLIAITHDITVVIATQEYLAATHLVAWVIIGVMIAGAFFPTTVGLHIQKKTGLIAKLMLYTALLNMILNVIFVPIWGINGAAVATLISCFFQVVIGFIKSSAYIKIKPDYRFYLICFLSSIGMYFALQKVHFPIESRVIILILKIILGIAIYIVPIYIFDHKSRYYTKQLKEKFISKLQMSKK
ncbi:oligosaccharide flippase family protein [candidate division KSB1 bacterium]|nr:oligosaccharide flippase family protein [candidate division KSB1 bacterium]